ncbi:MAG: D-alanyl-D-alanine carboxypeptidase [Caulobacteraceae bacterium]|nr:D-alanyl-D-alanine carboxypeptidase [Caulobacteraceae bacterium]
MYEPARRVFLALSLAAATIFTLDFGAATQASAYITTASKYAAFVEDASTGEVLYERNSDEQRYPASITKTMTAYLTFEALASGRLKLTDRVPFSVLAARQAPSRLGVAVGDSISVDEALRALAVKSANDVAVALAERVGGTEANFAVMMTERARQLGMTNTRYVNANGLPDSRQVTTAHDIATLFRALMRDYPQYYSYFDLKSFAYRGAIIPTHNDLVLRTPGVDGSKTGFTNAAGFNIVASAVRDNRRLIAVVMGGDSKAARDAHEEDLLDAGFLVLRRRGQGQQTTVAQNLFEAAPIGPITRPPTEEGSADQDGLKIVLTGSQPAAKADAGGLTGAELASLHAAAPAQATPPAPAQLADNDDAAASPARLIRAKADRVEADAVRRHLHDADRGEARAMKDNGDWVIQVGAYKARSLADAQARNIQHRYAAQLRVGHTVVDKGHGYYRARIAGLSAVAAQRACALISAHGSACAVYQPDA